MEKDDQGQEDLASAGGRSLREDKTLIRAKVGCRRAVQHTLQAALKSGCARGPSGLQLSVLPGPTPDVSDSIALRMTPRPACLRETPGFGSSARFKSS